MRQEMKYNRKRVSVEVDQQPTCTYMCMFGCVCVCVCLCMCVYVSVCIYVYVGMSMCVCVCICIMCDVCMFRPIWRRVPSADGPVGRWDGPSVNILSRLQTGPSADGTAHLQTFCPVCKHLRRYDQSGDFFNPRRCDAGRRAYCPTILTTSCSFCSFTFCFLSRFFSVLQVFISSLKDGNPGII